MAIEQVLDEVRKARVEAAMKIAAEQILQLEDNIAKREKEITKFKEQIAHFEGLDFTDAEVIREIERYHNGGGLVSYNTIKMLT